MESTSVLTAEIFNIQKFSINDGPGIRSTVFFAGCPLSCLWCSNPESQNCNREKAIATGDPKLAGRRWTVDEVMKEVIKDKDFYEESGGGITLSGGEVLMQYEFAIELMKKAHAEGIHVAAETTGFTSAKIFEEFTDHIDLLLFDMKHFDREMHHAKTGVYNDQIIANMRRAVEKGIPVIARIPVIPHFNVGIKNAEGLASLLCDIGIKEVHLLPFHQFGEKKYEQLGLSYTMTGVKQLHPETLGRYRQVFLDKGLDCSFK